MTPGFIGEIVRVITESSLEFVILASLDFAPRGLLAILICTSARTAQAGRRPDLRRRVQDFQSRHRWDVGGISLSVEENYFHERLRPSRFSDLNPFDFEYNRLLYCFLVRQEQNKVRKFYWLPLLPLRRRPQRELYY